MTYILVTIGLMILVISAVLAIKNRYNTSKSISSFTVGVFIATFFMILPTEWTDGGQDLPIAYAFASSIAYSFDVLKAGQDFAQIETIGLTGILRTLYIGINYTCFIAAPLLASSLVLSLFGDMGEKMKLFFSFSKKCHVFSELNDNSLQLAKGIRKGKKGTVVFCNTKKAPEAMRTSARRYGCILLHKSCESVVLLRRFKKYEFYLVSNSEDSNIQTAETLILKHRDRGNRVVIINAFAHSGNNVKILEMLLKKQSCDVFDKLTEETLGYAVGSGVRTVFCDSENAEEDLIVKAKEKGFDLFEKKLEYFKPYPEYSRHEFTLRSLSEDGITGKRVKVKNNRFTEEFIEDAVQLRFIDEMSLFCNDLLFKYPLYSFAKEDKLISVMIAGCGSLGLTMLKTALWCGQIPGYKLKIRVYDKDATKAENELHKLCPEMASKEYDIKFIDTDINCEDFAKKIKESMDATYVVVATGDDELNINTAEYLFAEFRKNNGFEETPPIFARVRANIKSHNLSKESTFLNDRNIHIFGTAECIYSEKTLFNTELENLAFATHLCYFGALNESKDSFYYKEVLSNFHSSEYDRRSSMAAALHIATKLRICGVMGENEYTLSDAKADEFEKLIEDEALLDILARNEHDRWNAFMRSEGYVKASIEEMERYAKKTGSHKDDETKLHPCIVSWDELDNVAEKFIALKVSEKKPDFKKYDIKIVKEIPQIIRTANRLNLEE